MFGNIHQLGKEFSEVMRVKAGYLCSYSKMPLQAIMYFKSSKKCMI